MGGGGVWAVTVSLWWAVARYHFDNADRQVRQLVVVARGDVDPRLGVGAAGEGREREEERRWWWGGGVSGVRGRENVAARERERESVYAPGPQRAVVALPVRVTRALAVCTALPVTRALVRARSADTDREKRDCYELHCDELTV